MKRRYKVVNKIRFSISIIIITMIIIGTFSIITNDFKASAIKEVNYIKVEVKSGDNIWKIAREYRTDDQDIRELVYKIIKVNNIKNSLVYEGQVLQVPSERVNKNK